MFNAIPRRNRRRDREISRSHVAENGIRLSTVNISGPPTDAELDAEFGTPAEVGAGFIAIVDDSGAGSSDYLVWSDGTYWWYAAGTKAT